MRDAVGQTQAAFADRMGLKQNTYAQLEGGRNYPNIPTLWTICDALQAEMVDMNWILAGDPSGLKNRFAQALKHLYDLRQRQ